MDVLREREVKDSLERQLTEEQKLRGETRVHFNLLDTQQKKINENYIHRKKKSIIVEVRRRFFSLMNHDDIFAVWAQQKHNSNTTQKKITSSKQIVFDRLNRCQAIQIYTQHRLNDSSLFMSENWFECTF